MRGEFRIGDDDLVVPNNITNWGAAILLRMAMRNDDMSFFVGLCAAVYDPLMTLSQIEEPTIGVNGYARIPLVRNSTNWPTEGQQISSPYIETRSVTWTPTGTGFNKPITRMFLCNDLVSPTANLFAISAAFAEPVLIKTPFVARYRIYAR